MTILTEEKPAVETVEQLDLETTLSQTAPDLIDISWIAEVLQGAAERAQAHYLYQHGENYKVEDLKQCFISWLDSSIELLCDEAFDFCVQDSLNPFNRHAFQMALLRIKPAEPEESKPDAIPY